MSGRAGANELRREGEVWLVVSALDGRTVRLRDGAGLRLLAELVDRPGQERHVLDLSPDPVAGAAQVAAGGLDDTAKAAYRRRVNDLRAEIDEAEDGHDIERAEQLRMELAELTREISRAVGLGGRNRRTGTAAERARVRVTRSLRAMVERLRPELPRLAAHMDHGLHTGTYCAYRPDPAAPVSWRVDAVGAPGPELDAAAAVPARLEAFAVEAFIGRERELSRMAEQWKQARAGAARLALVSGEPGIGKTGLAAAFARVVALDGGLVAYGRADDQLELPYEPWVEIVQCLAPAPGVEALLRRLTSGGAPGALGATDPQAEQFLLFREVGELLETASSAKPLLVVVDDLHWADQPSLRLVRYLTGLAALHHVLFVCTHRTVDPPPGSPLLGLMEVASRDPTVEWLELSGLTLGEVGELAGRHGSSHAPADLLGATNGNLFFLNELLRHESEAGDDDHAVPATVRQVVTRRAARLGREVDEVLRLAAVVGGEFDPSLLANVSGAGEERTIDALEAATAGALTVSSGPDAYTFAHALVATTLYRELSPTQRRRRHRRVAEVLERRGGKARAAELARHWMAAGDRAKAYVWSRAAGDHAAQVFAPAEAAAWYARAVELAPDDAPVRCGLTVQLGATQRQAGIANHETTLTSAFDEAHRLGRSDLMADAALASTRLGTTSNIGRVDAVRVERLSRAIDALGAEPSPRRARLLSMLAVELSYDLDADRRKGTARLAVDAARRARDPATLLAVLIAAIEALRAVDTLAERLDLSAEAIVLAEHSADQAVQFWALRARVIALDEAGDRDGGDPLVDRLVELADRLHQPTIHVAAGWAASKRAWLDGDLDAARHWAEEMGRQAELAGHPDAAINQASSMIPITRARAEWVAATRIASLERWAAGGAVAYEHSQAMLANVHLMANQPDVAAELVAAATRRGFDAPDTQLWAQTMAEWSMAVADLHDRTAATVLDPLLVPFAPQFIVTSSANNGCFHHYLGRLAATRGDHALADVRFGSALDAHRRIRAPHHIADTQLAWSGSRLERPAPEEESARQLWLEAMAAAQRHGFVLLERRGRALAMRFPGALF